MAVDLLEVLEQRGLAGPHVALHGDGEGSPGRPQPQLLAAGQRPHQVGGEAEGGRGQQHHQHTRQGSQHPCLLSLVLEKYTTIAVDRYVFSTVIR